MRGCLSIDRIATSRHLMKSMPSPGAWLSYHEYASAMSCLASGRKTNFSGISHQYRPLYLLPSHDRIRVLPKTPLSTGQLFFLPFKNWYVGIVLGNAVPNIFDHQDSLWQRQGLNIFAQRCHVGNIAKKAARVNRFLCAEWAEFRQNRARKGSQRLPLARLVGSNPPRRIRRRSGSRAAKPYRGAGCYACLGFL